MPLSSIYDRDSQELTRPGVRAFLWHYLGFILKTAANFGVGVVLVRLLGPEPFGQIAIATLVIGLANVVADFGVSSALIQKQHLVPEDIRLVFTFQMVLGLGMSSAIFLGAGAIAKVFAAPEATPVLQAIAPVFVISSAGQTAFSILRRSLNFRVLQFVMITSYIGSYVGVAIPLAFLGVGVWSLVAAQLLFSFLQTAQVIWRVRHPLRPIVNKRIAGFLGFGTRATGSVLAGWIIENLDTILVSRAFGVAALGYYNRAFFLAYGPVNSLVMALQGVLFPSYSRRQDEQQAIRNVFLSSITIVLAVVTPVMVSVAVVSKTVLLTLYGEQWIAAGPLLMGLALAMPLYAFVALVTPLLWGIGQIAIEAKAQMWSALFAIVVLVTTSQHSLTVLVSGVVGIYFVRSVLLALVTRKPLGVTYSDLLNALKGPLLLAVSTGASVWVCERLLQEAGWRPVLRLSMDVVTGCLAVGISAMVLRNILWTEQVQWLWTRMSIPFPQLKRPAFSGGFRWHRSIK